MATHYYAPVLGKKMRLTKLDSCGNLLADGTANGFVVTDGFISVKLSAEVEDGNEIVQRNAAGNICINERASSSFKRFNVEITFCGVCPAVVSFVSNAEMYQDYAGDNAGFTIPEGALTKTFALEVWTGLAGQACGVGTEASGYLLLPFIMSGTLGDIEITGEDAVTFSMTGAFTKGGNGWGDGPYKVVYNNSSQAAFLPTALDPLDHLLLIDTALATPPLSCNPQPMPVNGTTTTTTTVATTTTTTTGS